MPGPEFHRRVSILSVGDELALGQTLDTNSQWISGELTGAGVNVIEHRTVRDDAEAITRAIREIAECSDLLVTTGGLGPTKDDLTRKGLADALDAELVEDPEALASIRAYFERFGREMAEANALQALRPTIARWLRNDEGSAPGLAATMHNCDIFCLPGPPREMHAMFAREIAPTLRIASADQTATHALQVFGLPESEVAGRLGALMQRGANPVVGTTASNGVITCRTRFSGSPSEGDGALAEVERSIRNQLGSYVFAPAGVSLAGAVIELLNERSERLCVVESCTGGLLGSMLTGVSGSSAVFIGGWITYANEMKSGEVSVPDAMLVEHGAVSAPVARAMAEGALVSAAAGMADHALAITGVAGPEGGTDEKPVGTVFIARASRAGDRVDIRRFRFGGDRETVRHRSALSALAMLRFHLIGKNDLELLSEVERAGA